MSPKSKKSLSVFWHATMRGCTLAIAVLFVFFAIMSIVTTQAEKDEPGMTFSAMLTLTVFSLLVSYAKEIFRVKTLSLPAQWFINFLIVGAGFFLILLRNGMLAPTGDSYYIVGFFIYTLSYLAIFGITCLVKLIRAKRCLRPNADTENEEEYVSRFV